MNYEVKITVPYTDGNGKRKTLRFKHNHWKWEALGDPDYGRRYTTAIKAAQRELLNRATFEVKVKS